VLKNDRDFFLRRRERFNDLVTRGECESAEAAAMFYYLNRTGFNGLCRFNRRGEFNVPFGRYAKINYVRDFTPYSRLFRKWTFRCGDFAAMKLRSDDFLYVDPPYDVEFTTYSSGGFSWEDQERLVEWLARFEGPTVVSNQATPRILKLYRRSGFEITRVAAPRMISCTGDRSPAWEMIATRNL
jgi:DNA adenine methylase